jgi:hypothetical protein
MSEGSHEWYIVIFMPQDENKSCIYRIFFLFIIYICLVCDIAIWKTLSGIFVLAELKKRSPASHLWKYGQYVSVQWKIFFSQWKYWNWKYAFYAINISQYFIYKYINNKNKIKMYF